MIRSKVKLAALVLSAGLSGAAQAALHDRGGGLIYDDVLKVTWLQDANYAKTSGYDSDGSMNWSRAMTWASELLYYDSVREVSYSDWRLPSMLVTGLIDASGGECTASSPDCGWNVKTYDSETGTVYSELAYMYFINLGLKSAFDTFGNFQSDYGIFRNGTYNGVDNNSPNGQNDVGPFKNVQSYAYWTGLEFMPNVGGPYSFVDGAWAFITREGYQTQACGSCNEMFGWAVRDGDVAAVPEPETYAMMLAGLVIVGAAARRRKQLKPQVL